MRKGAMDSYAKFEDEKFIGFLVMAENRSPPSMSVQGKVLDVTEV